MRHVVQLRRGKKTSMYLGGLLMSFESIINFTKKILRVLSLIASIVFNNPIGVEDFIYWTYE